jgi:hypothetical protein
MTKRSTTIQLARKRAKMASATCAPERVSYNKVSWDFPAMAMHAV